MTKSFKKRLDKAISIVMAVAMLVGMLPAEMLGGTTSVKAATVTKSLDFSAVSKGSSFTTNEFFEKANTNTELMIGGYNSGDETVEKISASDIADYDFAIFKATGANTFINLSSGRLETQATGKYQAASVQIAPKSNATVTVTWAPGGNSRYLTVWPVTGEALGTAVEATGYRDANGVAFDGFTAEADSVKNTKYTSIFNLEAGTYQMGSNSSGMYIYSIDVVEEVAAVQGEYGTVVWDFKNPNTSLGTNGEINGAEGTVLSEDTTSEGVANLSEALKTLNVDATTGKLTERGSDAQFNTGAKIQVPLGVGKNTVTVVAYPGYHNYTVDGKAADADTTVVTKTVAATGSYVEIEATATAYLYSITLKVEEAPSITESDVRVRVYDNEVPNDTTDGSDEVVVFTAGDDAKEAEDKDHITLSTEKEYALSVKGKETTHKALVDGEESFAPDMVESQDVTVIVTERKLTSLATLSITGMDILGDAGKLVVTDNTDKTTTEFTKDAESTTMDIEYGHSYTISTEVEKVKVSIDGSNTTGVEVDKDGITFTAGEEDATIAVKIESTVVVAPVSFAAKDDAFEVPAGLTVKFVPKDTENATIEGVKAGDEVEFVIGDTYYASVDSADHKDDYATESKVAVTAETASVDVVLTKVDTTKHVYDVWDFGAEQLKNTKYITYNNKLTADIINKNFFKEGTVAGSTGNKLIDAILEADGADYFEIHQKAGESSGNRLRSTNEALARWDSSRQLSSDDQMKYTGTFEANGAHVDATYAAVKLQKGDVLIAYATYANGPDKVKISMADGSYPVEYTPTGAKEIAECKYYAKADGIYRIYMSGAAGKLIIARVLRETPNTVTVSGSIKEGPETYPAGAAVVLTAYAQDDVELKDAVFTTEAAIAADGTYSANVKEQYNYKVSLKNLDAYIVADLNETTTNMYEIKSEDGNQKVDITLQAVDLVTVTGTFKEASNTEEANSALATYLKNHALELKFANAEKIYVPELTYDGANFKVVLERGVEYTLSEKNVDDYNLTTESFATTVSAPAETEADREIVFTAKAKYPVDVKLADYDKYNYADDSTTDGADLTVANTGINKITFTRVNVADSVATPDGYVYEFTGANLANVELRDGQYQVAVTAVDGAGYTQTLTKDVKVNGAATSVVVPFKSNEAPAEVPYAETITVGADKDYATINDALEAVRNMNRTEDQRVTIVIDPGNYEEMLRVDVANVTLKNASATPSIALKNKGVDIADNAVRITSYYGVGHNFYSMTDGYLYSEDAFEVNKHNGYYSIDNPTGGGTGDMWNATVWVSKSGFEADGIIFENSFNQYISAKAAADILAPQSGAKGENSTGGSRNNMAVGSTAVQAKAYVERAAAFAFSDNVDKAYMNNCKIISHQDTLYGGKNTRLAFNKCSIYGGTDYIFGGMTAVFNECELVLNTDGVDKNDVAHITAPQTAAGTRGMLFFNCDVVSTSPERDDTAATKVALNANTFGRCWAAGTGEAVFVKTTVGTKQDGKSLIAPEGWNAGLSGTSPRMTEYKTTELSGEDNSASRSADFGGVLEAPVLADGASLTFKTFLGDWNPFGKEMDLIVLEPEADLSTDKIYYENIKVQLTSGTEGAKIYYTVDGTEPTVESTEYTGEAIALTGENGEEVVRTIKAIAVKEGLEDSIVTTLNYQINLPAMVTKKGTVDLSNGLNAGVVYGAQDKIEITVLENMPFKASDSAVEIEGVSYSGCVAGSNNAKDSSGSNAKGGLAVSGAAFEFEAVADSSVTLVLKSANKAWYFLDITDPEKVEILDQGTAVEQGSKTLKFEAGKKYQFYLQGSKANVYAINYSYQMLSDYRMTRLNLEDGLKKGVVYGDEEIALFTVLEDFGARFDGNNVVELEGITYNGYVQGTNNPSPNKGATATAGAVLVIEAKDDCRLTLVTNSAKNSNKAYHFLNVTDGEEVDDGTQVAAGAMKYDLKAGKTYQFYLDGSKICLYDIMAEKGTKARKAWEKVADPVIKEAEIVTNENGELVVPFTMVIGDDGADSVTVTMYNEAGEELAKSMTKVPGTEGSVKFTPEKSGTYTFKIVASREDELDKLGEASATAEYVLPLGTPYVKNYANLKNGGVQIGWAPTDEAESYLVSYKLDAKDATESEQVAVTTKGDRVGEDWTYTFEGLEVGKTYIAYVQAVRGNEKSKGKGEIKFTVKKVDADEVPWNFTVYGGSISVDEDNVNDISKSANGYKGNANEGPVQVWSTGGKGKIVPASCEDGLAFYYTELDPIKDNFVLKAKVCVDEWTLSNGQEGFGLMVADRVGEMGDANYPLWNNSYMAVATKIEYRWNKEAGELTTDSEVAANTTMKLGIGTIARTGVPAGWSGASLPEGFNAITSTLEYSCGKKYGAGEYNIIGNCTNNDAVEGAVTELDFTLERNNTGYKITYTDKDGNSESKMYYDEKYFDEKGEYTGTYDAPGKKGTLAQINEKSMALGLFASRNAVVTFKDIQLTVTDAAKDAPAEERVRSLVDPVYSIASASNASSADYDLQFFSNVPGYVTIQAADGTYVANNLRIEAENTKLHFPITLKYGKNDFTWTMVPDADYEIGGKGTNVFLRDYNPRTEVFSVTYNTFGNKYIYVTPDATSAGAGTAEDPVDVATAVKFIGPGQTILLGGGTYKFNSSLTISRGISGTAEEPIRMIMDPEAEERPVFDFGKNYKTGMTLAGDYWLLQNIDITNSGDGTDGLKICGSYNVIDSVNAYKNGNTGIQISRLGGTDTNITEWPSYNTIKNCTSYLNADAGYEDADGFAAKLTVGPGNVFDGCIAAYNADDGWDLFAKVETGPIGVVTIKNSVAYYNGYVFDEKGTKINAGNGNGFKLGGSNITGYHKLINSIAFGNKAKGIDSNSCPDIQVENCISFNNESYNVALYTNSAENTDYSAKGVISYRTKYLDVEENLKFKGTQDKAKVNNETNFFWDEAAGVSKNTANVKVADDWFVSLEMPAFSSILGRNANGTVDMGDFLKLTDKAAAGVGARDLDTNGEASDYVTDEDLKAEKKELASKGLQVSVIADQVYTGKAIKPALRVSDGIAYLTTKDYSVKYKNNTKVGTATVTITGKGNYTGTVTTTFQIVPKAISGADVTLKNQQLADVANGKAKTPKVVVQWGKKKLAAKKDYTLTYYAKDDYDANYAAGKATALASVSEKGKYVIVIKGINNFTGEKTADYILVDKDHLLTKAKVTKIAKQTATGSEIKIEGLTVTLNKVGLTEGKDYTVSYLNNVKPGKATVIIRGMGEYAGEKQVNFTIVGTSIKKATVTGLAPALTYNGQAVTQEGLTLTMAGTKLTPNKDYTVSYKKNDKAGTAQIIFTGMGMYSGELKKSFKIIAHDIADEYKGTVGGTTDGTDDGADVATNDGTDKGHIIVEGLEADYVKGGVKLTDLKIKYYDEASDKTFYLKEGKDYTVSYKNNNKIATKLDYSKKSPYVVIKGKGGYKGTLTKHFIINPKMLNATKVVNRVKQSVTLNAPDVVASTKKNGWMSKITVTDMNGKKLAGSGKKADYVAKYTYASGENAGKEVGATDTVASGTLIKVTISAGPSGYYVGSNSATYKVVDKSMDVKKAKVKQTAVVSYTGEPITLDEFETCPLTVTLNGKTLTYGKDFVAVPGTYKNNTKKGTAKVTICGIGEYGGQKVVSFKITAKNFFQTDAEEGTNDGEDVGTHSGDDNGTHAGNDNGTHAGNDGADVK